MRSFFPWCTVSLPASPGIPRGACASMLTLQSASMEARTMVSLSPTTVSVPCTNTTEDEEGDGEGAPCEDG